MVFDLCGAFQGGQRSNVRANLLQPNEFAQGVNMDVDRHGDAITRRGVSRIGTARPAAITGLTFFSTPGIELLLAAAAQKLYKSEGGAWTEISGYTPGSGANVEFAQMLNLVYMTDGIGNVRKYNGTTITDCGSGASSPPVCKILVAHQGQLFATGTTVQDELLASDVLDGDVWDKVNNSINVGSGSGVNTALCSWEGSLLVVGQRDAVYLVNTDGTDASQWGVIGVPGNVGCLSHRSMKAFGKDVWFLARSGVHTVQKLTANAQYMVTDPVSEPIQNLIDRINWSYAHLSCATVWNNRYMLAVPLDTATEPDTVLVYNALIGRWTTPWTGWKARVFCQSLFDGEYRLNFGQSDGKVMQWLDYVPERIESDTEYKDDGVDIPSRLRTRSMIFEDVISEKIARYIEVEFYKSLASALVEVIPDSDAPVRVFENTISTAQPGITFPITFPLTWPRSRPIRRGASIYSAGRFYELQVEISSTSRKLRLRSIKAGAYPCTVRMIQ